jgi:hypothetical protein
VTRAASERGRSRGRVQSEGPASLPPGRARWLKDDRHAQHVYTGFLTVRLVETGQHRAIISGGIAR